jgi:hypothetical protein
MDSSLTNVSHIKVAVVKSQLAPKHVSKVVVQETGKNINASTVQAKDSTLQIQSNKILLTMAHLRLVSKFTKTS